MATATWLQPTAFRLGDPGPGLTAEVIEPGLRRLAADPGVCALVLFGSRARGEARPDSDLDLLVVHRDRLSPRGRLEADGKARQLLGDLPVDLDLLVEDAADVERLAGSRWHVIGRIRREGRVLHATG